MSNLDYRIPDDMAAEVLAEATRLYAEASKGYSFEDLQQACVDVQIPPHIIKQAIRNIEEKRSRKQAKRQEFRKEIQQQIKKGMFAGFALLIPAIAVSGVFIFRSQLEPVISGVISRFNPPQRKADTPFQTLTVKRGKLEYLTDPKGLSISVSNVSYYSSVDATIGTDGYKSLDILSQSNCEIRAIENRQTESSGNEKCQIGKVGESYSYKGIYNYRIKIIEVTRDSATFQIEQQEQQPQSSVKRLEDEVQRLEDEVQQLQEKPQQLQKQIEELQKERDLLKQQLQSKEEASKRLEKENSRLRLPTISPLVGR